MRRAWVSILLFAGCFTDLPNGPAADTTGGNGDTEASGATDGATSDATGARSGTGSGSTSPTDGSASTSEDPALTDSSTDGSEGADETSTGPEQFECDWETLESPIEFGASFPSHEDSQTSHVLHPWYSIKKHQFLLSASDLQAAGRPCGARLGGIAVRHVGYSQSTLPALRIGAGWTARENLTELLEPDDSPRIAYGPRDEATVGWVNDGWQSLLFDTVSAQWDGQSNLLLEFSMDGGGPAAVVVGPTIEMRMGGAADRHVFGYANVQGGPSYPFPGLTTIGADGEVPSLLLWFE